MARFDRYLLSQLLAVFGFFALVLVAVYWVNRAVGLFDRLIGDGQSALVFLEFSLLTLPNVIRLVLPIAAFAATLYVTQRLAQESELVVLQATGFSARRLSRPVWIFGLCVTAMMLILMHILVPASRAALASRSAEISQNVTARFLNDGQFMHPAPGVTLFIGEITEEGILRDLFLSDARAPEAPVLYTAARAFLVRPEAETGGGPKLVMEAGMVQQMQGETGALALTRFDHFTYDLGLMIKGLDTAATSLDALPTRALLQPSPALLSATGESPAAFAYEAQSRFAQPFLALAAALIGFGALLLGGFSRFGLWRPMAGAIALLALVQGVHTAAASAALKAEGAAPLAYAAPALGIALGLLLLWRADHPAGSGRHMRLGQAATDKSA